MSDNQTNELKPCPFCGSDNVALIYKDTFNGDFRRGVYCADCRTGVYPFYENEAVAITVWNTRMHGMLTAEQVKKAIRDCSTYASYDGCMYYASGIRMQALADELNKILVTSEIKLGGESDGRVHSQS